MLLIASMSLVLAAPGFTGTSREERFEGALLAQADLPQAAPIAGSDPGGIQAELEQLRSQRPGIGAPIGLMAGGGAALVVGSVLAVAFWPLIGIVIGLPFVAVGALVAVAGVALLIVGGALLPGRIRAVNRHRARVRELEAALRVPASAGRAPELMPGLRLAAF